MRTSQNTPLLKFKKLVNEFIEARVPERDLGCLETMYKEYACSEESYYAHDRSDTWLLYQQLRDLLIHMKNLEKQIGFINMDDVQNQKGGDDE